MPKKSEAAADAAADAPAEVDYAAYGDGTYYVPEHGLVVNGVLVDSPEKAAEVGFDRVAGRDDVEDASDVAADAPAAEEPVAPPTPAADAAGDAAAVDSAPEEA